MRYTGEGTGARSPPPHDTGIMGEVKAVSEAESVGSMDKAQGGRKETVAGK